MQQTLAMGLSKDKYMNTIKLIKVTNNVTITKKLETTTETYIVVEIEVLPSIEQYKHFFQYDTSEKAYRKMERMASDIFSTVAV